MEKRNKVANSPEIEAKKILLKYFFDGDFTPPHGVTESEYLEKLYKKYVNLYLERARTVERRLKK